jgi:hypothetical protein
MVVNDNIKANSLISIFTIAVLKDMGWYIVHFLALFIYSYKTGMR